MKNKPPVDFRGNSLDAGTLVAFNLSGEIALGTVKSWKEVPWPDHYPDYLKDDPRYQFKVDVVEGRGKKAGHVSTVTSRFNLMSLKGIV